MCTVFCCKFNMATALCVSIVSAQFYNVGTVITHKHFPLKFCVTN